MLPPSDSASPAPLHSAPILIPIRPSLLLVLPPYEIKSQPKRLRDPQLLAAPARHPNRSRNRMPSKPPHARARRQGDRRAQGGPQRDGPRTDQASQKGGRGTAGPEEAPRGTGPAPIRLHRRGAGRPQGPRRPPEVTRGTDPAPIRLHRRGAGGPKGKIRLRDEKTRPKPPYTKAKSSKKDPKSLWRGVKTSGR